MSKYSKFYVALAAFIAVLAQVAGDSVITAEEIGILVTALIGALGVFRVPNKFPIPPVAVDAIEQGKAQVDAAAPVFDDDFDGGFTHDGVAKRELP